MRNKRLFAVIAMLLLGTCVFALALPNAVEYGPDEFPRWQVELRRAETIFFGSLPITFPVSALGVNLISKSPNLWQSLGIACGISAVISLIDWILGRK